MLSFLAKHPPRTRVAHLDQITYDDGQSTVTFKSPSDRYLVINQLPPNPAGVSRSSVLAPPVHWHAQQDETFHVLQGAAEFDMDGQTTTIGEGQIVSVPRGCFHRFCNASDERPLLIEFVLEPKMRDRDETYFILGPEKPHQFRFLRMKSSETQIHAKNLTGDVGLGVSKGRSMYQKGNNNASKCWNSD